MQRCYSASPFSGSLLRKTLQFLFVCHYVHLLGLLSQTTFPLPFLHAQGISTPLSFAVQCLLPGMLSLPFLSRSSQPQSSGCPPAPNGLFLRGKVGLECRREKASLPWRPWHSHSSYTGWLCHLVWFTDCSPVLSFIRVTSREQQD
jgi:hypothetical protein